MCVKHYGGFCFRDFLGGPARKHIALFCRWQESPDGSSSGIGEFRAWYSLENSRAMEGDQFILEAFPESCSGRHRYLDHINSTIYIVFAVSCFDWYVRGSRLFFLEFRGNLFNPSRRRMDDIPSSHGLSWTVSSNCRKKGRFPRYLRS